jgi:hypothetical protein
VTVSGPSQSNGHADLPEDGAGVLANLPRTRPQRASARRAAARGSAAKAQQPHDGERATATAPAKTRASAKPKRAAAKPAKRPAKAKSARAPRRAAAEPVPRQGFASEEERATGSVQPPGGTELIGTAAEIISELAKAGISGGERLLRDVLSRLPH